MATTSIDLGEHFTTFVTELKANGRYRNVSEAVRAGLRLLESEETKYQIKLNALREALAEGESSGESAKSHSEIIADAKAELNGQ